MAAGASPAAAREAAASVGGNGRTVPEKDRYLFATAHTQDGPQTS